MPAKEDQPFSTSAAFAAPLGMFAPVAEYMLDAVERSVLFWDVMRQRGNQYREHQAETAPHVLDYEAELVVDGRTPRAPGQLCAGADRPARRRRDRPRSAPSSSSIRAPVTAPASAASRPTARSASRSRRAIPATSSASCPTRCPARPSRTSPRAEAVFLETVIARHPEAEGKPCVIGNCQAGWAVMMLAAHPARAVRPDHHRRLAALLLGRRPRPVPDALLRRAARRHAG